MKRRKINSVAMSEAVTHVSGDRAAHPESISWSTLGGSPVPDTCSDPNFLEYVILDRELCIWFRRSLLLVPFSPCRIFLHLWFVLHFLHLSCDPYYLVLCSHNIGSYAHGLGGVSYWYHFHLFVFFSIFGSF